MEHKVGEIVTLPDGRKAKVVVYNGENPCIKCIFGMCICDFELCMARTRSDHKNIIYKEIKEE